MQTEYTVDDKRLLFYCRAGYEKDASDEISDVAAEHELYGYPEFRPQSGYFSFHFYQAADAALFCQKVPVAQLIFTRQYFHSAVVIENLPKSDRVGAVIESLAIAREAAGDAWLAGKLVGSISVDYPDTESGKQVAKFAKKFSVPLRQALRKQGFMTNKENLSKPCLHIFLPDYERCYVGISYKKQRSIYHNGINRLKFPSDAPSRSTLKLEEAIIDLVKPSQRDHFLREGARAVDLGACPGGWTYQLVTRGMYVEAVDNGEMAPSLMRTGLVSYAAADGFKYKPEFGVVDLVICDMIEKPDRVNALLINWLTKPYAKATIFNLKLPMKNRYQTVKRLLATLNQQVRHCLNYQVDIQCKHLYHNRDEVTVSVIPSEISQFQ